MTCEGYDGQTWSHVTHIGYAYLAIKTNPPFARRLQGALCDPPTENNLLSVSRLTIDFSMLSFEFFQTTFLLKIMKTMKMLTKGLQIENIYLYMHLKVDAWVARTKSSSSEH